MASPRDGRFAKTSARPGPDEPTPDGAGFEVAGWSVPSSAVQLEATLREIGRLGLRHGSADWCFIDLLDGRGTSSRRVAVVHADEAQAPLAAALRGRGVRFGPTERALITGEPQLGTAGECQDASAPFRTLQPRSFLVVPLVARGERLGTITWMTTTSQGLYGASDLERVEPFARCAGLALANARVYATSQRYRHRTESLIDLVRRLGETMVPEEIAARIADNLRELFGVQAAALYRLDSRTGTLVPVACSGPPAARAVLDRRRPWATGLVGLAVARHQAVVTPHLLGDTRLVFPSELRARIDEGPLRSAAAVPLLFQDRAVGALTIADGAGRLFRADELRLLDIFGTQVALIWQNARLFARTKRQREEAFALEAVAREITSSLDEGEVFRRVVEKVRALCQADLAFLATLEADGVTVRVRSRSGADAAGRLPAAFSLADGEGLAGGMIESVQRLAAAGTWEVAPIRFRAVTRGFLVALRASERSFARRERVLVRKLADQAAIAMENARLYRQADEVATARERMRLAVGLHDSLSQLLFSMGLKLDWCVHQPGIPPAVKIKLDEIDAEIGRILEQIRGFIGQLSRQDTPDPSLVGRLERLLGEFRHATGLEASLVITGELASVDSVRRDAVSKSLQEALANVARHARAARVVVDVHVDHRELRFDVVDDGIGPPPRVEMSDLEAAPGHFGLRHMRERLEALAGSLVLAAGKPSGFRLRGTLPLAGRP